MKTLLTLVMAFMATLLATAGTIVGKLFSDPPNAHDVQVCASLDLTELTASLGAYCRDPENVERIISSYLLDWNPDENFTVLEAVGDETPVPIVNVVDFLRPNNDNQFQPTAGAIKVGAEILKTHRFKGDLQIVPAQFIPTWLGKYRSLKRIGTEHESIMEIPLEEYIMTQIVKSAAHQIRMKAAYQGVRNNAGTTPGSTMNGIDTIIKAKRTANEFVPTNTGAISSSNILDKLYAVHDDLSPAMKNEMTIAPLSDRLFQWAYALINPAPTNVVIVDNKEYKALRYENEVQLPKTNVMLKREPGRATDTEMIYITKKENLFYVVDRRADYTNISLEKNHRVIDLMIDGRGGFGIGIVEDGMFAANERN